MNVSEVLEWLAVRPEIESVRTAVCDLNGIMRGKLMPVGQVEKVLKGGLRMPLSIVGVDIWGEDVVGSTEVFATGDADGFCEMTGRGILPMTWARNGGALIPYWMRQDDGQPFMADPRRALAAVLERYRKHGLTPVVATELEFYLVDPSEQRPMPPISPATGRRLDTDAVLSIDEVDEFEDFLKDVYLACAAQGIPADATIGENGCGQFEINLSHVPDALKAADDALFFKRTVKGVARKHGFAATFMAKPYGERSGNGLHVHFSVLDQDGRNIFDDGSADGSRTLRHAVGGLLAGMAETAALFAPNLNSYRRLRPGTHAPSGIAWGYENRTVAIRIPGGSASSRRIEHRVAGADANPYLAIAAILGTALIGIEREIEPAEPIVGNAYDHDLPNLAYDWASAIAAFRSGPMVADIFSLPLRRMFVDCKRQELSIFAERVTTFEYVSYLETV